MGDFVRVEDPDGRVRFVCLLTERFPAVAAEIDEIEKGEMHLEMGVLARATCRSIESGDWVQVRGFLSFVEELFIAAPAGLENAIYVSFLENVFLGQESSRYATARTMLSAGLKAALADLEQHWRAIARHKSA